MDEEVLGIISPTEGKGKVRFGGTIKRYARVFTPSRMVAAKLAGFLTILVGGLGDAGDVFARWRSVKTRDLAGMSIEDILRSDKDNYAIKYSDVIKVEMVKPRFLGQGGILIHLAKEKHNFVMLTEEGFRNCVDLVSAVMPGKSSTR